MRFLYSLLLYVLFPLVLLRMLWRSRRAPEYRRRLAERFGVFATEFDASHPAIWVHAVSVGEVQAAAPLIEALLRDYPTHRIIVTTTTPTGSAQVRALFAERVFHVYAPWDLPGAVRRFLRRSRPQLLILMETELWLNTLHYSRAQGCQVLLANARMSARSARGYRRAGRMTYQLLATLDQVACQSSADAARFHTLGLPTNASSVTGNIKFDLELDATKRDQIAALRRQLQADQRPIVVAASTHDSEEELILSAFRYLRQSSANCLLILVPRHHERFEAVYALCMAQGWRVARRSLGEEANGSVDILLGDTMGELPLLLGTATCAVIGGSWVEHGGHNPLEAAVWGVPLVCGPHMFNFTPISTLLQAAGAMQQLATPAQLGPALQALVADAHRCQQMGAAGRQVLLENRGATTALLNLIARMLKDQ